MPKANKIKHIQLLSFYLVWSSSDVPHMYDIRCHDIMEPNSVGRLSGGSVTKQCSGQNWKTTQNRLTQYSIKMYHLRKNGTVIVIEMNMV